MKRTLGPTDRLYPMPCPLVLGGVDDDADTLPVAWIGIASHTPPSVSMALRNSRHTLAMIRKTGEFTVNFPTSEMAEVVDFCGIVSGRDRDKIAQTGLTLAPSSLVTPPLIAECPYNLECRVTHEIEIGEYVLVIGEIIESHAEEGILDDTGEKVDVAALDPLIYIAGSKEYRKVGEKVGDAFEIGKALRSRVE